MRRSKYFKHIPTSESIQQNRFLKPFSRYLHHHYLWQFNRRGVAGGLAVGLFVGILIPFAQVLIGTIGAIFLRVNLPIAAFATFATNPLTVPPLYYAAYRLGKFVIGSDVSKSAVIGPGMFDKVVNDQGEVSSWADNLLTWIQTVGPELMTGLAIIAVVSALAGYVVVNLIWHLQARYRWHKRRSRSCAE